MATPNSKATPAGRPVPVLPQESSGPTTTATNEKTLDTDSDSEVHRHVPSSVPRTKFTPQTPASEKAAMEKLQQKIAFDNQSPPSSAPSTPERKSKTPSGAENQGPLSRSPGPSEESATVTMFAPVGSGGGGDTSDYASEGEITSSQVSISVVLSKLDTVKRYIKEAESLHKQLQEKITEPGVLTQLGKINKLIRDLHQQESSYLSVILAIMGKGGSTKGDASDARGLSAGVTGDQSEGESFEDESTSGESASSGVEEEDKGQDRNGEGVADQPVGLHPREQEERGDNSLSLRAQLMQESQKQKQEEEELRLLQQKHDMLKKMLEQQRQIQELEARQEALMQMRQKAQDQLSNAEARVVLTKPLPSERNSQRQSLELEQLASSAKATHPLKSSSVTAEETEGQEKEQQLHTRLAYLKSRKARMEEVISLLSALKDKEGETSEEVGQHSPETSRDHQGREYSTSAPTVAAKAAQDLAGASEMVNEDLKSVPELQEKMRQVEEARSKLSELQRLINLLKEMSPDLSVPEDLTNPQQRMEKEQKVGPVSTQPSDLLQPKYPRKQMLNTRQQMAKEIASVQKEFLGSTPPAVTLDSSQAEESEEEEEGEGGEESEGEDEGSEPTLDTTLPETEDGGESQDALEHSMVLDYEQRLVAKRVEVAELQQQRDKLLQTQKRLLELQGLISHKQQQQQAESTRRERMDEERRDAGEVMSSQLTLELKKQKQLYDELLRKTQQLQRLQTLLDQEGKGAVLSQEGDLTAATWGGSTAQSETSSTVSYDPNDTQESLELTHTLGGSAAVEHAGVTGGDMQFTVTRHTPRHRPPRRVLTPPEEPFPSTGKRLKLDPQTTATPGTVSGFRPPASSYSAVWPGVIFPSFSRNRQNTRDETTQTSLPVIPEQTQLQEQHISLLHQQLSSTSSMCGELLQGQNHLIHAICQRLDNLELQTTIQEHLGRLHLYQGELEQYYQELYQAYLKVSQQMPATTVTQSEQGEANGAGDEPAVSASGAATTVGTSELAGENAYTTNVQQELPQQSGPQEEQQKFAKYLDPSAMMFGFSPRRGSVAASTASQGQQPPTVENSLFSFGPQSGIVPPPPPPFCGPFFPLSSSLHLWSSPPRFPSPSYYGSQPPIQSGPPYSYTPSYRPFFASPGYRWPFSPSAGYTPQFSSRHTPHVYPGQHQPGVDEMASREGAYSPSGVTAASVQVQAPSSPPGSVSVNLQQNLSTTNVNLQPQPGGTTTYSQNFTGSTLRVPSTAGPTTGPTPLSTSFSKPPLVSYPPTAKATATGTLAQRERKPVLQATMTSREVATSLASSTQQEDQIQDADSLSSLPLSVPEETGSLPVSTAQLSTADQRDPPTDFSVFDALRDTIYSEVATLIANNEARPHFLVELFRELQLLSTDYLRQRALYSLQDLVTRYLTEEDVSQHTKPNWAGSASEQTPSESLVTSEDEAVRSKPPLPQSTSMGFDYVEAVHSASSVSTPPASIPDDPFASDNLGDTVIKLDKAMAKMRETYSSDYSPRMKPPVVSPGPVGDHVSESSQSDFMQYSDLDTQILDEQIKSIMTEVIPVLKEHLHSKCTPDLLNHIRQYVMSLVLMQEQSQKKELVEVFTKQLDATLNTTLCKYSNKKLKDCGEDLLVDVSEVLFNELAFFRLMQSTKGHSQVQGPDFKSVTSGSQTATENEDEELNQDESVPQLPTLDPTMQFLPGTHSGTIVDEEETLGRTRDDELAQAWDSHVQEHSSTVGADKDQSFKVELLASEVKPIESHGSGEEEGGSASGSSSSSQQTELSGAFKQGVRDSKEPTPVPAAEAVIAANGSAATETPADQVVGRAETPSTPLLSTEEHTNTSSSLKQVVPGGEPDVRETEEVGSANQPLSANQQPDALKQTEGDDEQIESPNVERDEQSWDPPSGITQAALEAQVKVEQESTTGLTGILSTIEGQELAGDGNELLEPVTAEP